MKKYMWIIATVVLCAALVYGATVGTYTVTKHTRNVQKITETAINIITAATVFERKVNCTSWTLWVNNTGDAALTDLDIYGYVDVTAEYELVDNAGSFAGIDQYGCSDTLATGSACIVVNQSDICFGEILVSATASTSAELSFTLLEKVE